MISGIHKLDFLELESESATVPLYKWGHFIWQQPVHTSLIALCSVACLPALPLQHPSLCEHPLCEHPLLCAE